MTVLVWGLLLLLLLLLLGAVKTQQPPQEGVLFDARYPITGCNASGNVTTLPNVLGIVTLRGDVLAQRLTLQFGLNASFSSCYLCEQYPTQRAQYCQRDAITPDHIYMALDTLVNLQVLLLDEAGVPQSLSAYQLQSDLGQNLFASNITIALPAPQRCGANYSLMISALLTLDEPLSKDIYALVYAPAPTAEAIPVSVPCRAHPLLRAMNIDCARTPLLYPVQYSARACMETRGGAYDTIDTTTPAALRAHGALYWYAALLLDNETTTTAALLPLVCGERAEILVFRSALYQTQCHASQQPRVGWWDALLIEYVCALLDAERAQCSDNALLRLALEARRALLERTCDRRDWQCRAEDDTDAAINTLAPLYTEVLTATDTGALCDTLAQYFEQHYSSARGDYTALTSQWGRGLWAVLVYPTKLLSTKMLLFDMIIFFSVLCAVCAIGVSGFKMRIRLKKEAITA